MTQLPSTSDLFKKHFGECGSANTNHPNMEAFFEELNEVCKEEDKIKSQPQEPKEGDEIYSQFLELQIEEMAAEIATLKSEQKEQFSKDTVDKFIEWWHRDYRYYPGYWFMLKSDGHKSFREVEYFTTTQLLGKFHHVGKISKNHLK